MDEFECGEREMGELGDAGAEAGEGCIGPRPVKGEPVGEVSKGRMGQDWVYLSFSHLACIEEGA
jgi:hypothetical protein